MVSSRRLAREWALKVLYQIDVGRTPPAEALDAALERLRMDFVHRGSRTASGSEAEQIALNCVTQHLRSLLPSMRIPLERAITAVTGLLFTEASHWQELRLETAVRNIERRFHLRAHSLAADPPRLTSPRPDALFRPSSPGDSLFALQEALTPDERRDCNAFVCGARKALPAELDGELKRAAQALVKPIVAEAGPSPDQVEMRSRLQEARDRSVAESADRWRKVGSVVQKQTGDWLRTACFTHRLVEGVLGERSVIDGRIAGLSAGWSLERQAAVDRNILRLAGYEMLCLGGVPAAASINEAVELAKKYSTAESGRFVNGVLGTLATSIGESKPAGPAADEAYPDEQLDLQDISETEETEII
jgi:N utilization substance protein B